MGGAAPGQRFLHRRYDDLDRKLAQRSQHEQDAWAHPGQLHAGLLLRRGARTDAGERRTSGRQRVADARLGTDRAVSRADRPHAPRRTQTYRVASARSRPDFRSFTRRCGRRGRCRHPRRVLLRARRSLRAPDRAERDGGGAVHEHRRAGWARCAGSRRDARRQVRQAHRDGLHVARGRPCRGA